MTFSPITHVFARQVLDSRGNPTVEVELGDGIHTVSAMVPSGASTGIHEALELRDGDTEVYMGKGVLKAVENVNTVLKEVVLGMDPAEQVALDQAMLAADDTKNKGKLGANAILGISLAAARLAAVQAGVPLWKHIASLFGGHEVSLPRPMMNVINGGEHANNGLAIQEFMLFPTFDTFEQNLRCGAEIFHTLKNILAKRGLNTGVGDEGGFAPNLEKVEDALSVLAEATEAAGYALDTEVQFTLDAAASEFYDKKTQLYTVDGKTFTAEALTDFYVDLCDRYPIVSIEDSHDEDDFAGFKGITEKLGETVQLVGDDLFVTNVERLGRGIAEGVANSILIKLNQIGTLSETLETIRLAKSNGYETIISHRSGETSDTFIADLAVGTAAGQIKTGSLSRSERTAKYNQLLRISEQL